MKQKIYLPIALLALLGLGLLLSQVNGAQGQDAVGGKAAEIQAALQNPDLDPQMRTSLEEKLELTQRVESEKAAGRANPAPKQPGTPPDFGPQISSQETPPSGIFEGGEAIIHGFQAEILNHWQATIDGQLVQVYAGLLTEDPEQGLLYVAVWVDHTPQITRYLTPARDGAARILSVEDDLLLRVETSGGSSWLFDWRSGEFR